MSRVLFPRDMNVAVHSQTNPQRVYFKRMPSLNCHPTRSFPHTRLSSQREGRFLQNDKWRGVTQQSAMSIHRVSTKIKPRPSGGGTHLPAPAARSQHTKPVRAKQCGKNSLAFQSLFAHFFQGQRRRHSNPKPKTSMAKKRCSSTPRFRSPLELRLLTKWSFQFNPISL